MKLQPHRMGDPAPVARDLFHARRSWRRASGPTSGSAGARIPTSPSRPWSCRSAGRAPRSATRSQQITDRLERKLQETPNLDYLKSYTTPGPGDDLRQPEGFDAPGSGAGHLVSGAQEGLRHPQRPAAGHRRPRLQRRVRRHLRHRLRLHRRRLHATASCRDYVDDVRKQLLAGAGHLEDRRPRRAGRADLCRVLDRAARGPRDRPRGADRRARAQNAVTPQGVVQTDDEKILVRVSRRVPRPSRTSWPSISSPTAG